MIRYVIRKSRSLTQPYYFEIQRTGNNETLATSETYTTKLAARTAIDLIRGGGGEVVDLA